MLKICMVPKPVIRIRKWSHRLGFTGRIALLIRFPTMLPQGSQTPLESYSMENWAVAPSSSLSRTANLETYFCPASEYPMMFVVALHYTVFSFSPSARPEAPKNCFVSASRMYSSSFSVAMASAWVLSSLIQTPFFVSYTNRLHPVSPRMER